VDEADLFDRLPRDRVASSTNLIEWDTSRGGLVAKIHGMIEASTVDDIDAEIESKLASRPQLIVFDLGGVEYVSSVGWGIFAKYYERSSEWGGKIAVCEMNHDLQAIFSCLEFRSFIPAFATVEGALSGIESTVERGEPTAGRETPRELTEEELPSRDGGPGEQGVLELDELIESSRQSVEEGADVVPSGDERPGGDGDWADEAGKIGGEDVGPLLEPIAGDGSKGPRDGFVDFDEFPTDVSMERGVRDEHIDEDSKLREMGWEAYGERLKKRLGESSGEGDEDDS
jgi:anti-anti-sigma factor